jgi:7-cyano-7-deazaguanine synthase in queuosine biosynthesis
MANEHLILCGAARLTSNDAAWRGARSHRLCLGKGPKDVHLTIEHLTRQMCADLPPVAADLLEMAAFVYAADQLVTRGGSRSFEYGLAWRRRFRFEIPVRALDVWQRGPVQRALAEVLSFLSDDDYEFGFTRLTDPPPLSRYLFGGPGPEGGQAHQEVALFSGGLDSLGGAVREILQGKRRIVLVSHRPVSKVYSRQRRLVAAIAERLPNRHLRPLHIAVQVNKGKALGRDFTQRSRSFLFAAVAAVVARVFGLPRIRFYENGVTSLNLAISPQVLGGRASRTTHPRVLEGFGRLFSLLFGCDFKAENPFLWQTKAEVLGEIKTAGHGALCALAGSCTHTWAETTERTHCGRCSQCVDRRVAALAAGLEEGDDPPARYTSDVLTGPREGADLTLVERYVGSARRVEAIKDGLAFATRYGEVARVLRHVGLPPRDAAEEVFRLYRRHASQVCQAVARAVQLHADSIARCTYPPNSLLGAVLGRAAPRPPAIDAGRVEGAPEQGQGRAGLELDDETFEARVAGKSCFLGNTFEYWVLARLNQQAGVFVPVNALRDDVWGGTQVEKNTVQRTISNVRRNLRQAGITEVVIDGSQAGHYCLRLQF